MTEPALKIEEYDFRPQTIEEYNRELDEADACIEAGDYVTHEEVMRKYFGDHETGKPLQ